MRTHVSARPFGGKAINPTALTCPNCGHRMSLFEREPQAVRVETSRRDAAHPTNLRSARSVSRPALFVLRGGLLWFSIVLLTVGAFSGLMRQSIVPALTGVGLLAVYGLTSLLVGR